MARLLRSYLPPTLHLAKLTIMNVKALGTSGEAVHGSLYIKAGEWHV